MDMKTLILLCLLIPGLTPLLWAGPPEPKFRANFGLKQENWKDGITNSPHGASIDKDGNLIVTEWSAFGRLHKFLRKN